MIKLGNLEIDPEDKENIKLQVESVLHIINN